MRDRLWYLLTGWGAVGVVYNLTDTLQRSGTVLSPSFIDQMVTFNPIGIWFYFSFFLIIPLAYLTCPIWRLRWLRNAMVITALCSGAVYLLWPTTLLYPTFVPDSSLSAKMLAQLVQVDSAQNCLPSLHMALTVLAVWAMSRRERPLRTGLYLLWGLAIGFSILQLRRHLFVDLLSGTALAVGTGALLWRVVRPARTTSQGKIP
ncbi:MAG: phosphatase PAP2 family protein [Ewingella sp.]